MCVGMEGSAFTHNMDGDWLLPFDAKRSLMQLCLGMKSNLVYPLTLLKERYCGCAFEIAKASNGICIRCVDGIFTAIMSQPATVAVEKDLT